MVPRDPASRSTALSPHPLRAPVAAAAERERERQRLLRALFRQLPGARRAVQENVAP
jgi:hypothetical protein